MNHLVEKAQTGDPKALNMLVQEWYGPIYQFAWKYFLSRVHTGDARHWAQEAAQKTFVQAIEALPRLKDTQKFRAWLYRIATNCCRQELRSLGRRPTQPMGNLPAAYVAELENGQSHSQGPEAQLQQEELSDMLRRAMNELPEDQRIVLIMKEYQGLKFREIAEALEISENTAKSRLYYAFKHLRKQVAIQELLINP